MSASESGGQSSGGSGQGGALRQRQTAKMPATAAIYKKKYCQCENMNCARHMVFKAFGKPKVPGDLFPNQVDRANKMISDDVTKAA